MFKVSFKKWGTTVPKYVQKYEKTTCVSLLGVVEMSDFWDSIPNTIRFWIKEHPSVSIVEDYTNRKLLVTVRGKARCRENDKYDTVLGERLAESRAKMKLYKFFCVLSSKLYDYYKKILFGTGGAIASEGSNDSLERCMYKYDKLYRHELKHQEELLKDKKDGQ